MEIAGRRSLIITERRFHFMMDCSYIALIQEGNQKIKLNQLIGLMNMDKTSNL